MVMAFEAGAHVTDAVKKNDLRQSFDIASSGVFDQLMQLCISQMDSMLDKVTSPPNHHRKYSPISIHLNAHPYHPCANPTIHILHA